MLSRNYLLKILISNHNLQHFKKKQHKNYKKSKPKIKISFKSSYLSFCHQSLIILLTPSLKSSCLIQNVLLNLNRKNTYSYCWEIKELLQSYFIVGQCMGGWKKTSTHVVTKKVQQSPYLRSKMEIALAASPKFSGNVEVQTLVIQLPCSSTSHNRGIFHIHKKQTQRYGLARDLAFMEVLNQSQV